MVDKKLYLKFFILVTLCTAILDQLTKYLVVLFKPKFDIGFLKIYLVTNTGAGFGILQGQTLGLAIVSLFVAIFIVASYKKIPVQKAPQFLFAIFLGGVIGNLIDRVFLGHVIDFIDFAFWPTFNIADAAISLSLIGLMWFFWKK